MNNIKTEFQLELQNLLELLTTELTKFYNNTGQLSITLHIEKTGYLAVKYKSTLDDNNIYIRKNPIVSLFYFISRERLDKDKLLKQLKIILDKYINSVSINSKDDFMKP